MRDRPSPYRLERALRGMAWHSARLRFGSLLRALGARLRERRARAELEAQSDHQLRDLGILRHEIRQVLRQARLRATHP